MILITVKKARIAAVALGLLAASCSGAADAPDETVVVATTTVLGDIVRAVAGDEARVEVLMPAGADPHDFDPSSRQVGLMAGADLVVANGLGLEEGLTDVLEAVASDGVPVLEVGPEVDPLPFGDGSSLDPHVWMDPLRVGEAARVIAAALEDLDPAGAWSTRAEDFASQASATHGRIAAILDAIPADRRVVVVNHDSLGYLADRYGLEVAGVILPGGSTMSEPGSEHLAALAATIDARAIPAILVGANEADDIAAALAEEADHPVEVIVLYTGSLGPADTSAGTLLGMLEEDARLIAGALG